MRPLTRPDLDTLGAHKPEPPVPGAVVLSGNEVPYGPLPGVLKAITASGQQVHRYPDAANQDLRAALASRLDVPAERIVTGCGSVSLTDFLMRAACEPGDEVVFAWPSFEAYPYLSRAGRLRGVPVSVRPDHGHDLPAMAAAVSDHTSLVIVCSPNNPTGVAARAAELDAFLDAVPADVLVVIDEAYREFVTDPDVPDALARYGDRPNVAVMRTMSKAWGLAGLRLGYLVASPPVAGAVRKLVTPYSTNSLAQAAALVALSAADEMARRVGLVIAERERMLLEIRKLFPDTPTSEANFTWLPLGQLSAGLVSSCAQARVLVRCFPDTGVRVTVGRPEENDAFLATLTNWVDETGAGKI